MSPAASCPRFRLLRAAHRFSVAGGWVVAVVLLAACGGGPSPAARTATPAASPTAVARTVATATAAPPGTAAAPTDLTAALLLASEVGAGWSDAGRSSTRGDTDQTRLCGVNRSYATLLRSRAQFSSGAGGSVIDQVVTAYAPGDARRVLDDNGDLLRSCPEWRDTGPDGAAVAFRLAPLPIPNLGDQSVAMQIDIERRPAPARLAVVLVRRGDLTSSLLLTSTGENLPPVDAALVERLARRADERLAAVAGSR